MITMRRRVSDWQQKEELTLSCHELIAVLITDSVPPEFGTEGLRDIWLYIVEGFVCIPDQDLITFEHTVDLANMRFLNEIYTDNESFIKNAILPEGVVVSPMTTYSKLAIA